MSTNRGMFVTLEGSEGVGKTTSLNFIKAYIESHGHKVVTTREPGGTPMAEEIRDILLLERDEKVDEQTELLLMFAARCQHVSQVINPALDAGHWVLCDRFVDASYAYQGGGRGINFSKIEEIEKFCLGDFKPDLTILLDMSVEEGIARTKKRGAADRFEIEKMDFYENIRQAYLKRAAQEPHRVKTVDAQPNIEIVQASLKNVLESFISANKR